MTTRSRLTDDESRAMRDLLKERKEMARLEEMQSRSWVTYFRKREEGTPTNGAALSRIDNRVQYQSSELARAESPVWAICDRHGFSDLDEAIRAFQEEMQ